MFHTHTRTHTQAQEASSVGPHIPPTTLSAAHGARPHRHCRPSHHHISAFRIALREKHENHLNRLQAPRSHEETKGTSVVEMILDLVLKNGDAVLLVVGASLARPHNQRGNKRDDGDHTGDDTEDALAHQQDRQDHRHKRHKDGDDGKGGSSVHR